MRSTRERPDGPRGFVAAIGALVLTTLLGCSNELPGPIASAGPEGAEPKRGGVLQLATFGDLRALDPANVSDGFAAPILAPIFAGLVDYDALGNVQPDIAERWVVDDGGKTYRFFLRQGVRFHDGEEVTADDIKRSAERALHGSAPNPFASYFSSIAGFADLNERRAETLSGVEVEGRYVVSFRLTEPDATFLRVLALVNLRPVCKSAGARYSDTWHACGAGPFKLPPGGWERGRTLTVVRHDGYFRAGLPYLDGVRWTFHQNLNNQAFKFLRGDLDVLREITTPDQLRFQADARWKPFADATDGHQIIGEAMNVEMPPFDNVEIRRAVAAALDRTALARVRASTLYPTNQLVPHGVFGHDPSLEGQRFDYTAALEHMRRAGYPYDPVTKTGGYPHVIPYLVNVKGLQEYTGQVLAQQLEKIGLRIELRIVNYPTLMALRGRRKETPFGPGFWVQDYPDALSFLEPIFHSKAISAEDSNNVSFYANPRFDELVDRAHKELDDERRKTLYSEAQKILIDDAPWAFTQNVRHYVQRQGYVHGYRPHPMWLHDVSGTWLDRVAGPISSRALFSERGLAALLGTSFDRAPRGVSSRAATPEGRQ
ncbi:MAG TPA: ABC transporter substrate-binding protein [Labilithrix sp.]|nr:ABC transporter substrate-binding protein [Labilithrix sp.]